MRAFLLIAATSAATLFAGSVGAETAPVVTESEFLAPLDAAEHPALTSLRQSLTEAEAAALGARVLANPELGASRETPGELEQIDVSVSWQLPHPTRRRLAVAAADARVTATRSRFEVERAVLRQTLRETFARWATSAATVETLRRWSGELERLATRESDRAAVGETSGLDARRLALAASEARGRLARAEAERLEALAAARAWRSDLASDALPEPAPLAKHPADAADAADPADLVGATADDHPVLVALRAELEAAKAERDLATRVADMPAVSAGWQRQEAGGEVADGATVGLSWTVPLFDRRQAERQSARARVTATSARLEIAERETRARREGAVVAYAALRAAAIEASSFAAESRGITTAATAAFQAGETSVTDLLDALRSAAEAEVAALELHAEALAAHRRLEQIVGARAHSTGSATTPATGR